jgi:hypothetical protein
MAHDLFSFTTFLMKGKKMEGGVNSLGFFPPRNVFLVSWLFGIFPGA